MKRREFLSYTGAGLAAATLDAAGVSTALAQSATSGAGERHFELIIIDRVEKLIDGEEVAVLAFKRASGSGSGTVPGPVLRCVEGEQITVTITNERPEAHGFEIGGIPASKLAGIAENETRSVTFTAPQGGTYMYHDASHPSFHLYRLLGLHGASIVQPRDGNATTANGSVTPYSMDKVAEAPVAAASLAALFDAFGTTARFPGTPDGNRGKWVPCPLDQEYSNQERIWLFSEVDPRFNAFIKADGVYGANMPTTAAAAVEMWTPRYFTINGRSGFDLSEGPVAESVVFKNYIGEPSLIRTMNAGLCVHATHIHGNHVMELSQSILTADTIRFPVANHRAEDLGREVAPGEVVVNDEFWERDVWPTVPMQIRDVLLPFEVPPDIPDWNRFANGTNQEPFPLRYVMHDHCEMGTTAAGGNYPQGAVTHWEIEGPLGGRKLSNSGTGSASAPAPSAG